MMKKIALYICLLSFSVLSASAETLKTQFKLADGKIILGQAPTSDPSYNLFIGGYKGLQWTSYGGASLHISIDGQRPAIYGNNRIIRFYNTDLNTYNNLGVKTTFAFMYDDMYSVAEPMANGSLAKIMAIDAGTTGSAKASLAGTTEKELYGLSAESIRKALPELTVTDEDGHLLVNAGSLVALLTGTLQSLQEQAEEQQKLIENLTATPSLKTTQKKSADLSDIETVNDDKKILTSSPNPFRSKTTLHLFINDGVKEARLLITDLNGQLFMEKRIEDRGTVRQTVDAHGWQSGIYIATLVTDGISERTIKLIKK